jgi:hypothetical protein
VAQLREVRESGVAGLSLFSWDSLADAPSLAAALAAEATGDDRG